MRTAPLAFGLPCRLPGETPYAAERAAYRVQLIKITCAILLGVCFWYAVPYSFPLQLDPDPLKGAAAEAAAYQGNMSRQIAMPVVLLISMYLWFRLPRLGGRLRWNRLAGIAVAYAVWSCASLVWSSDVPTTAKRLVVFAINASCATALATVATAEELALFGFLATGLVALIALCADTLVLHAFNPFNPDYRFMGVMTANYQAMNLFVCLVCGLTLAQKSARRFLLLTPFLLLFTILLFLTRARIGTFLFAAAAIFIAVRSARHQLRAQGRAVALMTALALLLPGLAFAAGRSGTGALSSVFMMGRSDTESTASLSNRAPLWQELLGSVQEHPLLGFGFEAFWTAERVEKISMDQGWVVPHAHNTYLDQALSGGLFGCLLYGGVVIGGCVMAWQRYRRMPDALTLMPALLLSWLALLGFTESIPLAPYLPSLLAYTCLAKMCVEDADLPGKEPNSLAPSIPPRSQGRWPAMWSSRQGAYRKAGQ